MRIPIIVQANPRNCVPFNVWISEGDWVVKCDHPNQHLLETVEGTVSIAVERQIRGNQSVRVILDPAVQAKQISIYAERITQ